jgi:DNA-nicking Smr family endonuclease
MTRRRQLSDEEQALWTGFSRSITPLRRVEQEAAAKESKKSHVSGAEIDRGVTRAGGRQEAAPAKKLPPLAPLEWRLRRRVGRGREAIDARLDLHGKTQKEAHTALLRFLRRARADGAKIALVVTGKGSGKGSATSAPERGVLKRQVPLWLSLPEFRTYVVGFEDAHIGHGGQGALYVRLRRER